MIFAPHPDDEVLMTSGIIENAVTEGNKIKVVILTNGDYGASNKIYGQIRLSESIDALTFLGLKIEDIIFLGYGDTGMSKEDSFLRKLYYSESDTDIIKTSVGSQTYAISLNSNPNFASFKDFHSLLYGTPGDYNKKTIMSDIEAAVKMNLPDDIYVTSLYDGHGDHSTVYLFVVDSIINIKKQIPSYSPKLHESLIHPVNGDENSWPSREIDPFPIIPFTKPPQIEDLTTLKWESIESISVPDNMQVVPREFNKKYQAINKYYSQIYAPYFLNSFAKSNEFFWVRDFSNIALNAEVEVSSENSDYGQLGTKAIDGIRDGYPRYTEKEWVTTGELNGAWIKLSWTMPQWVKCLVLYDRPNLIDHIEKATLTFSDGDFIEVGPLTNNGSGDVISFQPKSITWIKLIISQASGENIGLSEFEVY